MWRRFPGAGRDALSRGHPVRPASVLPPLPLPQPVASLLLPSPLLLTEVLIHLTHGLPPRGGVCVASRCFPRTSKSIRHRGDAHSLAVSQPGLPPRPACRALPASSRTLRRRTLPPAGAPAALHLPAPAPHGGKQGTAPRRAATGPWSSVPPTLKVLYSASGVLVGTSV